MIWCNFFNSECLTTYQNTNGTDANFNCGTPIAEYPQGKGGSHNTSIPIGQANNLDLGWYQERNVSVRMIKEWIGVNLEAGMTVSNVSYSASHNNCAGGSVNQRGFKCHFYLKGMTP